MTGPAIPKPSVPYLASEEVAIALGVTLLPEAFHAVGDYLPNPTDSHFQFIGAVMASTDPPPVPPG